MTKFIKLKDKFINANDIGYIGFFDNTTSGENSGVSIIGIHFNKEVDTKTYLRIEYLGAKEREQARKDYKNLEKILLNPLTND